MAHPKASQIPLWFRGNQVEDALMTTKVNMLLIDLANSIPARGVMEGHIQRLDAFPTEDLAERPKISLAKQGAARTYRYMSGGPDCFLMSPITT